MLPENRPDKSEDRVVMFTNIFLGLKEKYGIEIKVDGQSVNEFLLTIPPKEVEELGEQLLKDLVDKLATKEKLELLLGDFHEKETGEERD